MASLLFQPASYERLIKRCNCSFDLIRSLSEPRATDVDRCAGKRCNTTTESRQTFKRSEKCLFEPTATERKWKCLFVKLMTNLTTAPLSNYSIWVTSFSVSAFPIYTSSCTLPASWRCQSLYRSACLFSLLTTILPSDELSHPLH